MNISAITTADLKDLLDRIPAEIKRREKEEKAKALKEIEALAAAHGFALEDLVGAPLGQNSCRLDRILTRGAIVEERSGEIRTSIQRQSGGEVAAAGERIDRDGRT